LTDLLRAPSAHHEPVIRLDRRLRQPSSDVGLVPSARGSQDLETDSQWWIASTTITRLGVKVICAHQLRREPHLLQ
jgi:hypothetical protein